MKLERGNILAVIAALTAATPGNARYPNHSNLYSCSVYEKGLEGTWRASRDIAAGKGSATATRDTYRWQPNEAIEFAPGMKLSWDMVYDWPADTGPQRNIPENQIMLDMHFSFLAKNGAIKNGTIFEKPARSWLHFYRSASPGRDRHPIATSLSTMTLWHQYGNERLSTRAIISLDNLLAFGTGRDALEWNIRSQPDVFGGTNMIAEGSLPIATMRRAPADILMLRKMLNKTAANFRKDCKIVPMVPIAVSPSG